MPFACVCCLAPPGRRAIEVVATKHEVNWFRVALTVLGVSL